MQRQDSLIGIQSRARDRDQRRGLIVAPVKSAQNPIEAWNLDGGANAGISGILVHRASIMREPQPAVERKPACRFELIFQENRFHVGPGDGSLWSDISASSRVIHYRIELIVPLAKRLEASVEIVPSPPDAQSRNATYEVRAAIVLGANRVFRASAIVGTIEVIERRDGDQHSIRSRMQPGKVDEVIALIFDIMQNIAGSRIYRNLVVIAADRSSQAKLVGGRLIENDRPEPA